MIRVVRNIPWGKGGGREGEGEGGRGKGRATGTEGRGETAGMVRVVKNIFKRMGRGGRDGVDQGA